jgi:hypothetical protein
MPDPVAAMNLPEDRSDVAVEPHRERAAHPFPTEAVTRGSSGDEAPHPSGVLRELRLWLLSLVLFAPALFPYAVHFAVQRPGRLATGFVDYDLPYYMANAREHFDNGKFRFFYSNPYDASYESSAIYVQPMTLGLATFMHLTGLAPNVVFLLFELVAGWVCARVALALYTEVVGLNDWPRRLGLLVFFWGAGLMVLAGIPYSLVTQHTVQKVFILDPFDGWWCLNFGRNMVYPTEALYHSLSFGCFLSLLRRRYALAAFLALILSWSHPYSGVEILLILVSWSAFELFFVQQGAVPVGFFAAVLTVLGLHFGYYLVFLTRFPEHRELMKKLALPWLLQAANFLPAYALVGALAAWSFRRLELARTFFADARNRFFLIWFIVAFALANHEFAIKPMQPLHFTRGYIWTPLFLMGTTALIDLFKTLRSRGGPLFGKLAVGAVVAVLLLDNTVWLGSFAWQAAHGRPSKDWTVTEDQLALYRWLSLPENHRAFVITADHDVAFLTSTYTPLRSWMGHVMHTPDIASRRREIAAFLEKGEVIDGWRGKTLLVPLDRSTPEPRWLAASGAQPVYENPSFRVYRWVAPLESPDRSRSDNRGHLETKAADPRLPPSGR